MGSWTKQTEFYLYENLNMDRKPRKNNKKVFFNSTKSIYR